MNKNIKMNQSRLHKPIAFLLPVILLVSTVLVFQVSENYFGNKTGYFMGFLFYWLVWCVAVPFLLMSKQEIHSLFPFKFSSLKPSHYILLLVPLVFAYSYALPNAIGAATFQIILFSLLLAVVNGTLEEFLWRGLFLKLLGNEKWLYILVSAIGFGIWHLAPQVVNPNKMPGGAISFVAFATALGVLFGFITYKSKSITPVIICHIIFDFAGLGARIYLT